MCQEGHFAIDSENTSFYDAAKVGTELTTEADWKRWGLYVGPQFDTLDVAVHDEFEKYFQERGVNAFVASFTSVYAAHKEHQLGRVKNFVDL